MSRYGALSDVSDRSAEIYPETVLSGNLPLQTRQKLRSYKCATWELYNKQSTIASVFLHLFLQCELDRPASLCAFFPLLDRQPFCPLCYSGKTFFNVIGDDSIIDILYIFIYYIVIKGRMYYNYFYRLSHVFWWYLYLGNKKLLFHLICLVIAFTFCRQK